jgi:hypothetical protein
LIDINAMATCRESRAPAGERANGAAAALRMAALP